MEHSAEKDAAVEALGDLIALHDSYRVNEDGWTVCLCGCVAEGDDDDGSHARHVAAVAVSDGWRPHPWLSDALRVIPPGEGA